MRVLSNSWDSAWVTVTPHEQRCFINALGEICHTFEMHDFEASLGASRESTQRLLQVIDGSYDEKHSVRMLLNRAELRVMSNAMRITLQEIDDWEFHTRLGVSRGEWQEILTQVDGILSSLDGTQKPAPSNDG